MLARRLIFNCVIFIVAIMAASFFGALHNQISYAISPVYFHELKFIQFGIPDTMHNPVGASWVGILASWWMGALFSVPIMLMVLSAPKYIGFHRMMNAFFMACVIVMGTALIIALIAVFIGIFAQENGANAANWAKSFSAPKQATLAGIMHNFSYIGAVIGAVIGYFHMYYFGIRDDGVNNRRYRGNSGLFGNSYGEKESLTPKEKIKELVGVEKGRRGLSKFGYNKDKAATRIRQRARENASRKMRKKQRD